LFDEVQRHLVAKGLKVATGTIVDATKAGDICVQRGTMHAWVAKGSEPAVFAFVLIDAEPVEISPLSRRGHLQGKRTGEPPRALAARDLGPAIRTTRRVARGSCIPALSQNRT
jgi:hypothetical protein